MLLASTAAFAFVGIQANDSHIVYNGRITWRNPLAPEFSYPGVSAEFRFKGTSVAMLAKPDSGQFMVEIDGQDPFKICFTEADSVVTLASNLSNSEHRVKVTYAIEGYDKHPQFRGFRLSDGGKMLKAPKRSKHKIEFIGNSITCGYGIEAESEKIHFSYETENHYYTYAARTARALGADYHAVARSGLGMYRNYSGPAEGNPDMCMPAIYGQTLYYDASERWDFSKFQPDLVCVNLGTNDMSTGCRDSVRYEKAALDFTRTLRRTYPKAQIVLLTGSMQTDEALDIVANALNRVCDKLRSEGDNRIYRFDMSPQDGSLGYGGDYHPSMRQAKKMADELTAYLRTITNW